MLSAPKPKEGYEMTKCVTKPDSALPETDDARSIEGPEADRQ